MGKHSPAHTHFQAFTQPEIDLNGKLTVNAAHRGVHIVQQSHRVVIYIIQYNFPITMLCVLQGLCACLFMIAAKVACKLISVCKCVHLLCIYTFACKSMFSCTITIRHDICSEHVCALLCIYFYLWERTYAQCR